MALVGEVDHLEPQLLADQFVEVADGLATDLRGGDEPAHAEVDQNAALDDLGDRRFDHFVVVVRFDDLFPGLEGARAALAQIELAVLVVDPVDHDFQGGADDEFLRFDRERKLAEGQDALGLAADVDQQFVLIFGDDDAGENLTLVEDFQAFFVQALFERQLVFFFVGGSCLGCRGGCGLLRFEVECASDGGVTSFVRIFYFWQPRHHQVPRCPITVLTIVFPHRAHGLPRRP